MNEITTTCETALALKNAGFPQPFPAFGQQWYFPETKELFLVTFVYSDGQVDFCFEGSAVSMLTAMPEGAIFAPQAHDVLEQMPGFTIGYEVSTKNWVVLDWIKPYCENTNPNEAAAQAWLKRKKEQ